MVDEGSVPWLDSEFGVLVKEEIVSAWEASTLVRLPLDKIIGKELPLIRVPIDSGIADDCVAEGLALANKIIARLKGCKSQTTAASCPSTRAEVLPKAVKKRRAEQSKDGDQSLTDSQQKRKRSALQEEVRALLTNLNPDGKTEWKFSYDVKYEMPSLFGIFYTSHVRATGKDKTCPSTREEALTLWSSVVGIWLQRFELAPPQNLVEAYFQVTGNGKMRKCTTDCFKSHADWKDEYTEMFKETVSSDQDVATHRTRLECQYFAWKEAQEYAHTLGKSAAEAADAGRQSIDAASTDQEYRLYRLYRRNVTEAQWVENIRRRLDDAYETVATDAARADAPHVRAPDASEDAARAAAAAAGKAVESPSHSFEV